MSIEQIKKTYVPKGTTCIVEGNVLSFEVATTDIAEVCRRLYRDHALALKTAFATDERREDASFKIYYVFGIPKEKYFLMPFISLKGTVSFPSLVSIIHELSWYELEMYTFFGLNPVGHAKIHSLILHDNWPSATYPLRKDFKWNNRPEIVKGDSLSFEVIKGEGIYELPVGPIHAGIIEPGHFRFSLAGEEVIGLEPYLGYTHKGIEKLFETLSLDEKISLSERVSGDSSYSHSLAFCQAIENISGVEISRRAAYLRVIFAELERIANHFNDIGFIMMDTAFVFGGSQGARLREIVMQLDEQLTGSRFLRGVNTIGGVLVDIDRQEQVKLIANIKSLLKDFNEVITIAMNSTSMTSRLEGSGVLDKQVGKDHGILGVAARALGIDIDARVDYPYAAYPELQNKVVQAQSGDVMGRFRIRIEEVADSFSLILQALEKMPKGAINTPKKPLKKNSKAVGIVEGWRGDIVYVVQTDKDGLISRVVVRDPSHLNWRSVPYAVVGNPVPEFPLINKSFNLSYSGSDK
jgi:Ni,Fe-hydrogenase III large subunit/Ni,Fe-hydrogenase III component G